MPGTASGRTEGAQRAREEVLAVLEEAAGSGRVKARQRAESSVSSVVTGLSA